MNALVPSRHISPNQYNSAKVQFGVTKIITHEVKFTWIIENFDFVEESDEELQSPIFSADTNEECQWFLSLSPNGLVVRDDEISLFLTLKGHKTVFAKFRAHILDFKFQELYGGVYKNGRDEIFKYGTPSVSWGWDCFVIKDDLFRSNYLCDNKLIIACNVVFFEANNNDVPDFKIPTCDLLESYAKLYESHEFADVIVCANGTNYPAHKLILCARSSVFAAMFKWNTIENELGRIVIEDTNEEVVGEMLRYIYTGKCENLDKLAEGLLAAADKYDLDRLKRMCAEALFENLSFENAANVLILAEMHCVNSLKIEAIKFIVGRFDEVMNTEGWKNVLRNSHLVNEVCLAACHKRSPW